MGGWGPAAPRLAKCWRVDGACLWRGCCPLGPFRRPPNALKAAAHDGPRPYAGGVSIAAPQRRPARRPGGPGPRLGVRVTRGGPQAHKRKALGADSTDSSRGPAERSARGTGRLRPNGPPAGGAEPGGPFGAEGAQHGHHPTGPLCAPEHIRGERPGRSRAGEKARPRSARRAWPCLFDGWRKRPHRCPAGPCGSIWPRCAGRANTWSPQGAFGAGGRRPALWAGGRHGGAVQLFHLPRPAANERGREGVPGAGCASGAGRPHLDVASRQQGQRKEQRSAFAVRCSFLDSADNDVHPVGTLSVYHS